MSSQAVSDKEYEFYYDQFGGSKYPTEFGNIEEHTHGITIHENLVAKVLPAILNELFQRDNNWVDDTSGTFSQAAMLSNQLARITIDQTEAFYQGIKAKNFKKEDE